jgi:hypothetical protein
MDNIFISSPSWLDSILQLDPLAADLKASAF